MAALVTSCLKRGTEMRWLAIAPLLLLSRASHAGLADVVAASAECAASVCTFTVTVRHTDEGWSHYANAWEVLAPDGSVLATRVLRHPHVDEQPFARELSGVRVPAGVTSVRIHARDSVHGFGGREMVVRLGPPDREQPEGRRASGSRIYVRGLSTTTGMSRVVPAWYLS